MDMLHVHFVQIKGFLYEHFQVLFHPRMVCEILQAVNVCYHIIEPKPTRWNIWLPE